MSSGTETAMAIELRADTAIRARVQRDGGSANPGTLGSRDGRRVLEAITGIERERRRFSQRTDRVVQEIAAGNALRFARGRQDEGRDSGEVQATH